MAIGKSDVVIRIRDKCRGLSKRIFRVLVDETGSLVILIFTFFLLLLILIFGIMNVSDAFLAKRELIGIGEVAISKAAHQISLDRYYSGNILMDQSGADGSNFRIPIDCGGAWTAFESEVATSNLRGHPISITDWSCINDEVSGTLSVHIPTLIALPFDLSRGGENISSTVAATSIIGGTRG